MGKNAVIIGGSFAGLSAAYDLKNETEGEDVNITVIDKSSKFTFIPSLIWVFYGKKDLKDITFDLKDALESKGINFVQDTATKIDTDTQVVKTKKGKYPYDYLVLATGPDLEFDIVPGLGPDKFSHSVCNGPHAVEAYKAWQEFLEDPGDIIIGATQGASCFGAAYEVLFNVMHALERVGLKGKVKVHFVSAEPYIGHFGIAGFNSLLQVGPMAHSEPLAGMFIDMNNIEAHVNVGIKEVKEDGIVLDDGKDTFIAGKYKMIIPPFLGAKVIRESGLGNERGFVPVDFETFQHKDHPNIYAVGIAPAIPPVEETPLPTGVPKTGYPSEIMGKIAASNIAAEIKGLGEKAGKRLHDMPALCILDAGDNGVIMLANKLCGMPHAGDRGEIGACDYKRKGVMIPGPWAHWGKILFEKYFMWKMQKGKVAWP